AQAGTQNQNSQPLNFALDSRLRGNERSTNPTRCRTIRFTRNLHPPGQSKIAGRGPGDGGKHSAAASAAVAREGIEQVVGVVALIEGLRLAAEIHVEAVALTTLAAIVEALRRPGFRLNLVVRIGVVLVHAAVSRSGTLESEGVSCRDGAERERAG